MRYATFWQRFAAMWIDFAVVLPLGVVHAWLDSLSKVAALTLAVPVAALYWAYVIYCHGRWGQTIGKHVMGIRVVHITGERIGWRGAWLRSCVDVALGGLGVVGTLVALTAIKDVDYYGVGWMQRAQNVNALVPSWLRWTNVAGQIWVWGELISMLTNEKSRALHDFLAGTVVCDETRRRI